MSRKDTSVPRNSLLSRFLTAIERLGNALPHPATLFAILAFGLILLSWLFSRLGVSAVNPTDGAPVIPINLISREGLHWILEKTIENFTGFAPLGTVLVAMLGIGDSSTNLISPMMSFFALIVAFVQRYDSKAGIGTVIATMFPYSVAFLVGWMVL